MLTKEEELNQLKMEYSLFRSINVDFPSPPILHRSYNELDFEFEDDPEPLEVPMRPTLQRIVSNALNFEVPEQVPMRPTLQRISNAPNFEVPEQVPMRPTLQRISNALNFEVPEQVPMRPTLQRIVSNAPNFEVPEQVPMRPTLQRIVSNALNFEVPMCQRISNAPDVEQVPMHPLERLGRSVTY